MKKGVRVTAFLLATVLMVIAGLSIRRYAAIRLSLRKLTSVESRARAQAAESLYYLGWRAKDKTERTAWLYACLDSSEEEVLDEACAELLSMGPDGSRIIANRLTDDTPCQDAVYRTVVKSADAQLIPLVITRLRYGYETWPAIAALRRMGDVALDPILEELEKHTQDKPPTPEMIAALGALRVPGTIDALRSYLSYQPKSPAPLAHRDAAAFCCAQAALSLGQLGTNAARNVLQAALATEEYGGVRLAIAQALRWDSVDKRPAIVVVDLTNPEYFHTLVPNQLALRYFKWHHTERGVHKCDYYASTEGWTVVCQPAYTRPPASDWW